MTKRITKRVLRWVPPQLHAHLRTAIGNANWTAALLLASSENCISLCMDMFLARLIPDADQPAVLAQAISGGDAPHREYDMLLVCLIKFTGFGQRVFDSEAARAAHGELPETITIHRGTTQDEGNKHPYGMCWTLDRDKAQWFATKHGRFRNRVSPAVVLSATVERDDIGGLLFDRGEREVLICPNRLRNITMERVPL